MKTKISIKRLTLAFASLLLAVVLSGCSTFGGNETPILNGQFIVTAIEEYSDCCNKYWSEKDNASLHDNFFGGHDGCLIAPKGYNIGDTISVGKHYR
jgi:hypothetical protein